MPITIAAHNQKIDFIRGLAILFVVVFHFEIELFMNDLTVDYGSDGWEVFHSVKSMLLILSPTNFGWAGVTLFLVISGYLIHLGFLKNGGKFSYRDFFSKRFWRIFPPYWFVLIICSLFVGFRFFLTKDFIIHFVGMHNLFDFTYYSLNPPFWSLALEIQLYMLYPVFLWIREKVGINTTLMLTIVLSLILTALILIFGTLGTMYVVLHFVLRMWFTWAAGAWIAEVHFNGKRVLQKGALLYFVLLFVFLIVSKVYFYTGVYVQYYVATAMWILFIDWFLFTKSVRTDSRPFKVFVFFGLCSYSLYLIHHPLLYIFINYFHDLSISWLPSRMWAALPAFALIVVLAWMMHQVIELPSIQIGKNLRGRKKS